MAIRNPVEWGWDTFRRSATTDARAGRLARRRVTDAELSVRRIDLQDIRSALASGLDDFGATRTDVIFLCVVYPVIGLVLGRLAFGHGILPMLFPLATGFALVGPLAAVGLNEMSRRRERTGATRWGDAFRVLGSPSLGGIVLLALLMVAIFLAWMVAAGVIYAATLGPALPASAGAFAHDVFATRAGLALIVLGVGVGFLFAVLVLSISIVSFPLLLDRRVSAGTAIRTSFRAVAANRGMMALWGAIVVAGLVLGSIPLFIGLTIVLPVLGHATWHLYRRIVPGRPLG